MQIAPEEFRPEKQVAYYDIHSWVGPDERAVLTDCLKNVMC